MVLTKGTISSVDAGSLAVAIRNTPAPMAMADCQAILNLADTPFGSLYTTLRQSS